MLLKRLDMDVMRGGWSWALSRGEERSGLVSSETDDGGLCAGRADIVKTDARSRAMPM